MTILNCTECKFRKINRQNGENVLRTYWNKKEIHYKIHVIYNERHLCLRFQDADMFEHIYMYIKMTYKQQAKLH